LHILEFGLGEKHRGPIVNFQVFGGRVPRELRPAYETSIYTTIYPI